MGTRSLVAVTTSPVVPRAPFADVTQWILSLQEVIAFPLTHGGLNPPIFSSFITVSPSPNVLTLATLTCFHHQPALKVNDFWIFHTSTAFPGNDTGWCAAIKHPSFYNFSDGRPFKLVMKTFLRAGHVLDFNYSQEGDHWEWFKVLSLRPHLAALYCPYQLSLFPPFHPTYSSVTVDPPAVASGCLSPCDSVYLIYRKVLCTVLSASTSPHFLWESNPSKLSRGDSLSVHFH